MTTVATQYSTVDHYRRPQVLFFQPLQHYSSSVWIFSKYRINSKKKKKMGTVTNYWGWKNGKYAIAIWLCNWCTESVVDLRLTIWVSVGGTFCINLTFHSSPPNLFAYFSNSAIWFLTTEVRLQPICTCRNRICAHFHFLYDK